MPKQKNLGGNIPPEAEERNRPETLNSMPDGYEEQEDANFFKFEEIGDCIQGKLMVKARSKRYDFFLYTIKEGSTGDMKRFHGTQHLDTLMGNANEGDDVFIQFLDEQPTPQGNMKIFKVGIKPLRGGN